ncbi:hypothetical protein [Amorphus sp. MBR-141]
MTEGQAFDRRQRTTCLDPTMDDETFVREGLAIATAYLVLNEPTTSGEGA